MRILCWGTYDTSKPRSRILFEGLRNGGVHLIECHADIWHGVKDKSQVRGLRQRMRIGLSWLLSYPRLLWKLIRAPRPDVILIGFPGVLDILLAAPIARARGVPIAWDMFMSLYDTVVEDRQLLRRDGITARLLHRVEGFAIRRATLVFLDTEAHARRVEGLFNLPPGTAGSVWVGAERSFDPHCAAPTNAAEPCPAADGGALFRVLFYGQFIPLHGIETIVRAARLTKDEPIEWQLIGKGQEADRIQQLISAQPLPKLKWEPWIAYECLPRRISGADVCLGIFGTSGKAASVIPNKVFQIVAMGRPIITRDSPAIREMLADSVPCVTLIPPADPEALAGVVRALAAKRSACVHSCHTGLQEKLTPAAIGSQCIALLKNRLALES